MKKATELETLISYFPNYSSETLEEFIKCNETLIEIWRQNITEALHENEIMRSEIECRNADTAELRKG